MPPPLTALRIFGCAYYLYRRPYNKHKLLPRSVECVFLGYPPLSKGNLCLDLSTNTVYTACDALFNEDVFPFANKFDLITSHVSFSTAILDSKWYPNTSAYTSSSYSTPTSSSSTCTFSSSSLNCLFLDLLHSSTPISSVSNPSIQPSPSDSTSLLSSSIPNVDPSLSSSSSSSSSPSLDISIHVNTHPMLAKFKLGIHKPKVLQVTSDYTY